MRAQRFRVESTALLAKHPYTVHLSPMPEITARPSTTLADRYKIERQLGEGRMAIVYLPEDPKLIRARWRCARWARFYRHVVQVRTDARNPDP